MIPRSLFGGALTVFLPKSYVDLSETCMVPDNQEVYSNDKGTCFILEFVQPQPIPDDKSAEFYYNDIAQCNGGVSDKALTCEFKPNLSHPIRYCGTIRGKQTSKKSRSNDEILVHTSLAVYRFKEVDMLLSLTSEIESEQGIWDQLLQSLRLVNIQQLISSA